mmetsp:Transcript_11681/g.31427  ORF Transcript_11681/g.31427 Transcript_11681/m.31427 type:complete len:219 (+) Transcript_11681:1317-1973(+)
MVQGREVHHSNPLGQHLHGDGHGRPAQPWLVHGVILDDHDRLRARLLQRVRAAVRNIPLAFSGALLPHAELFRRRRDEVRIRHVALRGNALDHVVRGRLPFLLDKLVPRHHGRRLVRRQGSDRHRCDQGMEAERGEVRGIRHGDLAAAQVGAQLQENFTRPLFQATTKKDEEGAQGTLARRGGASQGIFVEVRVGRGRVWWFFWPEAEKASRFDSDQG